MQAVERQEVTLDTVSSSTRVRPLLLCLLPVRNAADDLPGFFASLSLYCDGVIALDDGSTDTTRALLEAEPLVWKVLTNAVRTDYRGWNDATNRNTLLRAAADFQPHWILSLDADECIDHEDGQALRTFLEQDALPGCAYGFRNAPMRHDLDHFLPRYIWVYRLFAYASRQRFPTQKLHFVPIPTSILRERWIKTTLRIQHLGELTVERRLARFTKYLEADPQRRYQERYIESLRVVDDEQLGIWLPRPPDLPVLLAEAEATIVQPGDRGAPAISIVIMLDDEDEDSLAVVESVVTQECAEPFEVILVTSNEPLPMPAWEFQTERPHIRLCQLPEGASPGEQRNEGLRAARGAFVLFLNSRFVLCPGNLEARLSAHRSGYTMVSDVVIPERLTPAGWARYFLVYGNRLPGSIAQALDGPPEACSYARLPLQESGGFPEGVWNDEDQGVNHELFRRGYLAYRDPASQVIDQHLPHNWLTFTWQQFRDGKWLGQQAIGAHRQIGNLLSSDIVKAALMGFVPQRLRHIADAVSGAAPDLQEVFRQEVPAIIAGTIVTWAGMWWEILRPAPGKWDVLFGRPVQMVLLVTSDGDQEVVLMQVDHLSLRIAVSPVSGSIVLADLLRDGQPLRLDQLAVHMHQYDTNRLVGLRRGVERSLDIEGIHVLFGPRDLMASLLPATSPDTSLSFTGGIRQGFQAWQAMRAGTLKTSLSLRSLLILMRICRYGDVKDKCKYQTRER